MLDRGIIYWRANIFKRSVAGLGFRRSKSLTSAINAGRFREGGLSPRWKPSRTNNDDEGDEWPLSPMDLGFSNDSSISKSSPRSNLQSNPRPNSTTAGAQEAESATPTGKKSRAKPSLDIYPKAPAAGIPFTKADAQFVYGHSSIHAALRAKRRRFYNLYIHKRAGEKAANIRALAAAAEVPYVVDVGNDWLPHMDKRSEGRPHNGLLLEASPIPIPKAPSGLANVSSHPGERDLTLAAEQWPFRDASRNYLLRYFLSKTPTWRYPLILILDDVLDPQNLGSILRSAYFLGVDAVGLVEGTVAPITSTVLKASAGAAEAIPMFYIPRDVGRWLSSCSAWRILASVTPSSGEMELGQQQMSTEPARKDRPVETVDGEGSPSNRDPSLTPQGSDQFPTTESSLVSIVASKQRPSWTSTAELSPHREREFLLSPASVHPTLLVVGGESRGLHKAITSRSHAFMHITPQILQDEVGVDSMNVGVAAAMVIGEVVSRAMQQNISRVKGSARQRRTGGRSDPGVGDSMQLDGRTDGTRMTRTFAAGDKTEWIRRSRKDTRLT